MEIQSLGDERYWSNFVQTNVSSSTICLGVPIRVEFGPNDKARSQLTVVLRHTGAKSMIPVDNCDIKLREILEQIHKDLYAK